MDRNHRARPLTVACMAGFVSAAMIGIPASSGQTSGAYRQAQALQANRANREDPQQRLSELQDVVSNLDHTIDILATQQPDRKGYRKIALNNATKARDALQREIDELERRGGTKERDVKAAHERDKEGARREAPKDYQSGIQTALTYVQHAEQTLSRQPGDPNGRRANALKFLKTAENALQKEWNETSGGRVPQR